MSKLNRLTDNPEQARSTQNLRSDPAVVRLLFPIDGQSLAIEPATTRAVPYDRANVSWCDCQRKAS